MLISIHSKSKYMSYIIISHQIIEENLISQQKKNSNGDRQLQSSNLQNKDKSTPYKPQPT